MNWCVAARPEAESCDNQNRKEQQQQQKKLLLLLMLPPATRPAGKSSNGDGVEAAYWAALDKGLRPGYSLVQLFVADSDS